MMGGNQLCIRKVFIMQNDLRRVKRNQQRRSLAEVLTAENPVFKSDEIVYEQDTGKFKIGDGESTWSELPYYIDADRTLQLIIDNGGGEGGISAWIYDSENNTLTPPNDADIEMSGGDIKANSGRIYLSDNISNVFRHLSDTSIVGGKEAVQFYVGDASAGVSEDRPVAQAVVDGFEVDPDGEGFIKVVLDNDPRLSGDESSQSWEVVIESKTLEGTAHTVYCAPTEPGLNVALPDPTEVHNTEAKWYIVNTSTDTEISVSNTSYGYVTVPRKETLVLGIGDSNGEEENGLVWVVIGYINVRAVGPTGQIQISGNNGEFDSTDSFIFDSAYGNMKIGKDEENQINLSIFGSLSFSGSDSQFWNSDTSKQLLRFNEYDGYYYFGEGNDENNLVHLTRHGNNAENPAIVVSVPYDEGRIGIVVEGAGGLQRFGILRDNGDIDYPNAGQSLYYDGLQMEWVDSIVTIDAGTNLNAERPLGAKTVYWKFDSGVDVGVNGNNIGYAAPSDFYFVASS